MAKRKGRERQVIEGRLDWEGKAGQGVKQRQCMEEKAVHGEKGCAGRERDGQERKACLKVQDEDRY